MDDAQHYVLFILEANVCCKEFLRMNMGLAVVSSVARPEQLLSMIIWSRESFSLLLREHVPRFACFVGTRPWTNDGTCTTSKCNDLF
mmetsp:Transcript_65516/g.129119  ORF Transcript_65516/g.129119 Transcript_65516/m.129119 type:complete len:87 (-) Transcript_65516:114-374(-)